MTGEDLQQHELHLAVARRLVDVTGVTAGDTILEVGAGQGRLTAALLARGCTVHAIELDLRRLAGLRSALAEPLATGQLVLHAGDARHLAPRMPAGWRVVANPPFRLGAALLKRWLLQDLPGGPPARIDLVLQREAAERFASASGAWTRLGVLGALWGETAQILALRRQDVEPPSKVDLCCWSFIRRDWARSAQELALVDRLLERGFAGPTTVRAALHGLITGPILQRAAGTHRWNADGPPRAVPPKAWLALALHLRALGKL